MLILVRHGRTALNAAGRLQGRIDEPLDDVGRAQAAAIAAHVGAVDVLISSPLTRATETAEAFDMPFATDERWVELSYGRLEGALVSDALSADVWAEWRSDPAFVPAGGESLLELDKRVRRACDELVELASERSVAVVTHVSPMKAAVAWALKAPVDIAWRSHLSHASVCRIEVTSNGPVLTAFNERAPLS